MTYRHGVYVSELDTALVPPRRISAGIPVVFGTAPVHMRVDGIIGPVNKPRFCYTYNEAVAAFGYSDDWEKYTLCEFFKAFFVLFNVAPMVVVNVFDPAVHKTAVPEESKKFGADGELHLDHAGVVGDPAVKNSDGNTTYEAGTDYEIDKVFGVITWLAGGGIASDETVKVSYDYGDPSLVDHDDIIGGIDGSTGASTGLELVNSIFPMFKIVPGVIAAPGWSQNPGVAAVMHAKAGNINGHFKAIAVVDIDSDAVPLYTDVPAAKSANNLTDEQLVVCWPRVRLGDDAYWLSSQVAGLLARVDAENDDIPGVSPSNNSLQMTAAVANGEEVWLDPIQANYLNGQGIVTALNFGSRGWVCWGNRTGAYPASTDPKDTFLSIRRMYNWNANTLILTYWQKVDKNITRRLIETVVDSENIRLNGLQAREFILGGRVEFREDENPVTDLMDGISRFHLYFTPPSPAREISFIVEYDPGYLSTLFG